MELDIQQQAAVTTDSKKALCIAGAGSGKTRVLTERMAYLMEEKKVSAYEILAVTFTRKAAGEVRQRLETRLGKKGTPITIGTVHAFALRMLRQFGEMGGFKPSQLTVYSPWETAYLLREVAIDLGVYDGKKWKILKREVDSMFDYFYQTGEEPEENDPKLKLFKEFFSRCKENNACTYGSLLTHLHDLLSNPKFMQYWKYKYILVDEVQDIDILQHNIINRMMGIGGESLFVVGDVDQCQPAGTMVLTPSGEVPIESLKCGDRVRAWTTNQKTPQGKIVQLGNSGRASRVLDIDCRNFTGEMIKVEAGGNETYCTPNHKWWVKYERVLLEVTADMLREGMSIPVWDGHRGHFWRPISIRRRLVVDVPVYSLNVEKHHAYVANGLCTLNSIYSWRGAVPEYLIEHQDEFDIYRLESNYRSCPEIVEASNRLIEHNKERIPRTMVATREGPGDITQMDEMDSERIASAIIDLKATGKDLCETVVLARNHILLKKLSETLTNLNFPHTRIGNTTDMMDQMEFRVFHAFLKLIQNPYDNFSFGLIRELLGVSRKQYGDIRLKAIRESKSHFHAFWKVMPADPQAIEFFSKAATDDSPALLAEIIQGIWPFDAPEITRFIEQWMDERGEGSLDDYLDWLATYDLQEEVKDADKNLKLMTIHAAKGLEWPTVIIVGCNDGILPSKQSVEAGDEEIESERRLFYVALTRAKDQIVLAVRPELTQTESGKYYENPVSRFLGEI